MRMASMTKSGWLRQKILGHLPRGGRGAGCSTLGSSHGWRHEKLAMNFTDHNWPKVAVNPHNHPHTPGSHLPGGDHRHTRLLRCPVEKLPIHPTLDQQPNYSLTRDKRWWGCKEDGTLDRHFQQNRQPPGPGAYHKSLPRGPHFGVDNGETVVLGANHPAHGRVPWETPLTPPTSTSTPSTSRRRNGLSPRPAEVFLTPAWVMASRLADLSSRTKAAYRQGLSTSITQPSAR